MSSLTVLLASGPEGLSLAGFGSLLGRVWPFVLILIGFSVVILFHELGHFLTAKWCGVRVDKLAIGFGKELAGFRRGETRYAINALPIGGYVKMLGQEDFSLDKSGQWQAASDPRSFTSQPVGRRMLIVSAGVAMNLIFAAVGFMIVFMIGMKSLPAKVGWVLPDSPAERYGLQSGDMIRRINGRWMDDFGDVMMAIALADRDETLTFQIERAGRLQSLRIPPEYSRERKLLQVGIGPALTRRVAYVGGRAGTGPSKAGLRVGDEIVAVDGKKVGDFLEMLLRMQARRGRPVQVLVNRPSDPDDPDSPKRMVACTARATMRFAPRRPGDDDTAHLLGLLPRCVVTVVKPRSPAAEAGMQPGDVIVRWADLDQPRPSEIRRSILQNEDQDLRVVVLRDGQRKELTIRPRRPLSWPFIKHPPQAGINFQGQDMDHAVVADTLAGWAVHDRLAIPRGARIVAVNEQRIGNWYDLVEALRAHAGQTVRLSWQHGDVQASGTLRVPNCLSALLGLPATAQILSIDGKNEVRVVEADGKERFLVLPYWRAIYELCKSALRGRDEATVEVVWLDRLTRQRTTRRVKITPESIDPWLQRVGYSVDDIRLEFEQVVLRASDPVHAMWIGIKKTGYFIYQTYRTIQRIIISRTVGIERISGPVGIVKMGSEIADAGLVKLLYFLAFISASLAVINFLPFPVVDGGLMLFLIIEKIKGRPVSLKLQMITQLVGLALIIGAFVFITIQDIMKWES